MKLPINENPYIRAYAEYMFLDSIINNNLTNDNCVAKISTLNFDKNKWEFYFRNADYFIHENRVDFYRRGFDFDSSKSFFRKLVTEDEEFVFCIEYQQYTNRWDSVVFFVDENNSEEKIDDYPSMTYVLGRYCSGDVFVMVRGKYIWIGCNMVTDFFKICIHQKSVYAYSSNNGVEWNLIHEAKDLLLSSEDDVKCGCVSCLFDNQYYKWLCNNFIQIKFNHEEMTRINYSDFIKRDNRIYSVHPFVKFSYEKSYNIEKWYGSLWNYIINSIQQKKYLQIMLNEYYVPQLEAYKKQEHIHESLIFGYDFENKSIHMMSICNGKPKIIEILERDLIKAWTKVPIVSFEYSPDINEYQLDIFHIYDEICDYLNGFNSSERHKYISEFDTGVFGMNIYNDILHNVRQKEVFLTDVRIAYLIKEHKLCMLKRFEYLKEWGLIPASEYTILEKQLQEVCKFSEKVLLLVIKNKVVKRESICKRIWIYMETMRNLEQGCLSRFKSILEVI